jgi:hypothetical protein
MPRKKTGIRHPGETPKQRAARKENAKRLMASMLKRIETMPEDALKMLADRLADRMGGKIE